MGADHRVQVYGAQMVSVPSWSIRWGVAFSSGIGMVWSTDGGWPLAQVPNTIGEWGGGKR